MRVLVVTGIYPPDVGGPATYVPRIAAALAERGHHIVVVTLSDSLDHDDSARPFRVVRLPRQLFKPLRWPLTVARLLWEARSAEVLFVNGLAMEAALANLLLRKPMVQKIVGDVAWERAVNRGWVKDGIETFQARWYGPRIEWLKTLRRWAVRRADRVIVPSQHLGRLVRGWGLSEDRLLVVYNALEPIDAVQPAALLLDGALKKAVAVGRLVAWKHVDDLIRVVSKMTDVGLVIVGDGPERGQLEELARRLNVAGRIHFAGQRSRAETAALMKACDVFILNSSYEGLPHVVLEAMGLGLAVIATATGGTSEVVKDDETGILIPVGDIDALRRALRRLLDSPEECRRLSAAARGTLKDFSHAAMVERTEQTLMTA